ncbi:MAG: T9SS type A sorting domain-containing protein [Bacteroidia bacterium]|nr:T9SS type A sorting domain-containing protein [Bacteroidia bacterium]
MKNDYLLKKTLFITLMLFNQLANAQLVIEWQKCYGGSTFEQPFTTERTRDGGIISAGFTESVDGDVGGNYGNHDWWILKTDKNGNIEWARHYGGTNYDKCRAIMQNDDGTYMAFGSSHSSNGDVPLNYGEADFWLLKLDSLGNILYNQVYGGSLEEGGRGIIRTADRGWMLVGWAASNDGDIVGNHGSKDAWLCKLDSNGAVQWSHCYGGSLEDRARYVIQLADGGYVFGGNAKSNDGDLSVNQGGEDFWIVRVDSVGNMLWNTPLGTTADDRIYYVAPDWDGGFLGIGRNGANNGDVNDNHGLEDLWIIKVDSMGSLVWSKSLGGSADDGGFRIEATADHGYFITGTTKSSDGDSPGTYGQSDYWFIKLDSALNFVWNDHIGGSRSDHCNDILYADDGGFYLTGFTLSSDTLPYAITNHGEGDYWFAKVFYCTDKDTSLTPGNTTICPGSDIDISTSTNYTAFNWSTGDTTNTINVSSPGSYSVVMSDFNGYCVYNSDTVVISNFATPAAPVISESGGILTASGTGTFQWYVNNTLIPGATANTLTNITTTDDYTCVVTDNNGCTASSSPFNLSVGLNNTTPENFVSVAPNPFKNELQLTFNSNTTSPGKIIIYNLQGQAVFNTIYDPVSGKNKLSLPLAWLESGTYLLSIQLQNSQRADRIIIRQ